MYIESPMENYNKNNPFIILAKNRYHDIISRIHQFTAYALSGMLTYVIICAIYLAINIVGYYGFGIKSHSFNCLCACVFILFYFVKFKEKLKYFMRDNEAMQEFEALSSLEMSDILTLNNERVMNNVNQLYSLSGELKAVTEMYKIVINIAVTIISIITLGNLIQLVFGNFI